MTIAQKLSAFVSSVTSLTATQQAQGRSNIYAAPFDALAYNGLQVNGAMDISQELGAGGRNTDGYIVDGWQVQSIGTQVMGATQIPAASATPPSGFNNSIRIAITTANASPAATNVCTFYQGFEGSRISRLGWGAAGASPLSIGFWVMAIRPGTYSASIKNGSANRSYAFSFTVNVSGVWEYKTVTIPGDTTGTWVKDNSLGGYVTISMMAGSSMTTTANTWTAGNFNGVTGTINGVASTSDQMYITGFIMLPGIELPSAARLPFIMRPLDQELLLCKRYFYNGVPPLHGVGTGGNLSRASCFHPITMRNAPALTLIAPLPVFNGSVATTITSIVSNFSTTTVLEIDSVIGASMVSGTAGGVYQGTGGNLNVDARLY